MKVRLKRIDCINNGATFSGFNSMKVRLKRLNDGKVYTPYKFQFHEGPIKTLVPKYPKKSFLVSIP